MNEWANDLCMYVGVCVCVCGGGYLRHEFLESWGIGYWTLPAASFPLSLLLLFSPVQEMAMSATPPRAAQTALWEKEGCHSPVPFSSPADVLGQPSRGWCCIAHTEHWDQRGSDREVLGVMLSPWKLSGASAQHWCCCVSSCFLPNSSSQLDRK